MTGNAFIGLSLSRAVSLFERFVSGQHIFVVIRKDAGDEHRLRTGQAVFAVRAADTFLHLKGLTQFSDKLLFRLRHYSGGGVLKYAQVILELLHRRNAAEDDGDLRLVVKPAECPFGERTFDGEIFDQRLGLR